MDEKEHKVFWRRSTCHYIDWPKCWYMNAHKMVLERLQSYFWFVWFSGAAATHLHVLNAKSRSCIARAISMSGTAFNSFANYDKTKQIDLLYDAFQEELGGRRNPLALLTFMRNAPIELLVEKTPAHGTYYGLSQAYWSAVVEGLYTFSWNRYLCDLFWKTLTKKWLFFFILNWFALKNRHTNRGAPIFNRTATWNLQNNQNWDGNVIRYQYCGKSSLNIIKFPSIEFDHFTHKL